MLKGLENLWYIVIDFNNVIFCNIFLGNYCFQVKIRIWNQEWVDEIVFLDICIDLFVWFMWWVKLFYIFLGVFVLYFIFYVYKKKLDMEFFYELEKKNYEQEQELNNECLCFYINIIYELCIFLMLILGLLEDMQKSNFLLGKDLQKILVIY